MIIKGLERLSAIDELNYLTMIAFRLYEKVFFFSLLFFFLLSPTKK